MSNLTDQKLGSCALVEVGTDLLVSSRSTFHMPRVP
jgi:hypothetical protein